MKKLVRITIFVAIIIMLTSSVVAQTTTSAPSQAPTTSKEIDQFKEKLASKVAELSKKNQKVIAGTVDSVDRKKLKLKTDDGNYDVNLDQDLTKFYLISGSQKTEKKLIDLKKGLYVIVSGPLVDHTIDANSIYQDEQYLVDFGKVIEVNKDDGSLSVATAAKENYILDIETSTKQQILDIKTLELDRGTFSKIKVGDGIHFVVKKDTNVKNRFSTLRVLIIPQEYFISK